MPFKKTVGIYRIFCAASRKSYVGASVDILSRWSHHRHDLARGNHHAPFLQSAWAKYGPDAFSLEILEVCDRVELAAREQHWIDALAAYGRSTGYNATPKAGTVAGRTMSDTTKEKLRAANIGRTVSGATRAKLCAARVGKKPNLGHSHSPETKARMSGARRGRRLGPQTPEHRANLSRAAKENRHGR